jgi:tetratricopeptide (TPR) repeat protein
MYQEARQNYQQALSLKPSNTMAELGLAGAFLSLGLRDQAQKLIDGVSSKSVTHRKVFYNLAARYAELRQSDRAIAYFRKALESGLEKRDVEWATKDPDFANLHGDPTFQALINERLGKNK